MDEQSIRQHLDEIQQRLNELDEEREVLLNLLRGYEGWLRLRGANSATQLKLGVPATARAVNEPKGKVSLRGAVLSVITDARGEPLHVKEILKRVQALGARTSAKNPLAIIDLSAHSLRKGGKAIERTAPRTWRWTNTSG